MPTKLSSKGIEQILELKLTESELAALKSSAESVRKNIQRLDELRQIAPAT